MIFKTWENDYFALFLSVLNTKKNIELHLFY